MQSDDFASAVKSLNFPNVFNPYTDTCLKYDKKDAHQSRFDLLRKIINEATKREIDSIWIGRDLGYRGGRRTGLALTDDRHIEEHAKRWEVCASHTTKGEILSELTATAIWNILNDIKGNIFLWNVFPLHPHEAENPFSNRPHNKEEHRAGEEIFDQLITLLNPKRLIAVGNDADETVKRFRGQREVYKVRHPSYGGQDKFQSQMKDLYSLNHRRVAF